jgi:hypothetical protein
MAGDIAGGFVPVVYEGTKLEVKTRVILDF